MKVKIIMIFILAYSSIYSQKNITINITGKISGMKVYKGIEYFYSSEDSKVWRMNKENIIDAEFGKKGNGPKELKYISNFQFLSNNIYISSGSKLIKYDLKGNYLEEKKYMDLAIILKNENWIKFTKKYGKQNIKYEISLVKKNAIVKISEINLPINKTQRLSAFNSFVKPKYIEYKKMFCFLNPNNSTIELYSDDGKFISRIEIEKKKLKVNESYKNLFYESIFRDPRFKDKRMQEMVKKQIYFSAYFPQIQDYYINESGDIFIKTFNIKKNKSLFYKYVINKNELIPYWFKDKNIDISNQSHFTAFSDNKYHYFYIDEDGEYKLYSKIFN